MDEQKNVKFSVLERIRKLEELMKDRKNHESGISMDDNCFVAVYCMTRYIFAKPTPQPVGDVREAE
eukprot:764659-Hanusia_phi.AAC.2